MDKINYEDRCHALISAVFKLQDRVKANEMEEQGTDHLVQEIEGDDYYLLYRTKSTMRLAGKTPNGYIKAKHYIRVLDPLNDIPMMLFEYLFYLKNKGEQE